MCGCRTRDSFKKESWLVRGNGAVGFGVRIGDNGAVVDEGS